MKIYNDPAQDVVVDTDESAQVIAARSVRVIRCSTLYAGYAQIGGDLDAGAAEIGGALVARYAKIGGVLDARGAKIGGGILAGGAQIGGGIYAGDPVKKADAQ